MKTVLITGSSTGIGRATAKYFQSKGWNVAATMRKPDEELELVNLENTICPRLDVTDRKSIDEAISKTLDVFESIDVVVNNAGFAVVGPFEATTEEDIHKQLNVNVVGLMNVIKGVLPSMRKKKSGTIINISSVGGRMAFPLYSLYHTSKWAVEGFSESLRYELDTQGITVKLVEPGPIKTDFYDRSMDIVENEGLNNYDEFVNLIMPNLKDFGEAGSPPEDVAKVIFKAATDGKSKLRYPAGKNAGTFLRLRSILPFNLFVKLMKKIVYK